MSVYDRPNKEPHRRLDWYIGVPLGSNPLILLDLVSLLAVAFVLCWVVLLAAQFWFDGFVELGHLWAAAIVAAHLCLLFTAFYVIVCFVVLRNRYAAQYLFDYEGARCHNLRCFPRALERRLLHCRPYAIEPPSDVTKSIEKFVPWTDVTQVTEIKELSVFVLRGRRGSLMRVYCPDGLYGPARQYVRDRAGV